LPSKIVLAALLAFFPMLVNAVEGLRAADSGRLKLMRALDASRWQTLRHVRLTYAMPFFLAGLELADIYSMLGALVGEFVGAQKGTGWSGPRAELSCASPRVEALPDETRVRPLRPDAAAVVWLADDMRPQPYQSSAQLQSQPCLPI
jgi:ABC-type nitrate/sulfonate/bicarbonate transport system permease component